MYCFQKTSQLTTYLGQLLLKIYRLGQLYYVLLPENITINYISWLATFENL